MRSRYQALADHAAANHGLFRTSDLAELGVTARQLEGLTADGWCEPLARGVHRVRAAPATEDQRLLAMVWLHPGTVVASHRAAARLHALPGFERARPEITIDQGRSRRGGQVQVHGSLLLPVQHRAAVRSIPCTTLVRTLFDLGGVVPAPRLASAVDWALSRRRCSIDELAGVFFVLARRGRPGTAAMRAILDERGEGFVAPASELERRARLLFTSSGLPAPDYEVDLGDGTWIGRVDCLWRRSKLVVELDGRRFHDGTTARQADRDRDNRLMASGWRVLRFTWQDITERPTWVVEVIRRALASGETSSP